MARRPRQNHSSAFKAKVALAAIRGEKAMAELAEQFDVHRNRISTWLEQLLVSTGELFGADKPDTPVEDVKGKRCERLTGFALADSTFCISHPNGRARGRCIRS